MMSTFKEQERGQPGWNRVKEKNSREEQRSERTEEAISVAYGREPSEHLEGQRSGMI